MKPRLVYGLVVAAFAATLGHLSWHALLGPPPAPEYLIGGDVQALCGTDPGAKQLYLRHKLYLSQRPRRAWIEVLGQDRLRVYVNGRFVSEQILDGFPVAVVADLAPYLRVGPNVIAVVARQSSIGQPPRVAVEGAYELSDGEHALTAPTGWRHSTVFERGACWWFEPDFDDGHWPEAQSIHCHLRGKVPRPPRVVSAVGAGRWITCPDLNQERAVFRRTFDVEGRPAQAWLRVTALASYRLALNGILLDEQEDQLDTTLPVPPIQRSYDITPVIRSGHNVLSLALASAAGPPHLLADLEVTNVAGGRLSLDTDAHWETRAGLSADWMAGDEASADWRPCHVEAGDLGVAPWYAQRQDVQSTAPWPVVLRNAAGEATWMALIVLLTLLACRLCAHALQPAPGLAALSARSDDAVRFRVRWRSLLRSPAAEGAVVLALVAPTVAIASGILATYDPRVARQDIYRGVWVFAAVLSVFVQWALLGLLASCGRSVGQVSEPAGRFGNLPHLLRPSTVATILVLVLMTIGFVLRLRDIESVRQWDEVENYTATRNFLTTGFPALEVHRDLPHLLIHTSEAQFLPMALAALFFDDDRYIVRFPMICLSTLGIGLIFLVGRSMFGVAVGLTAAVLYTFSPVCIGMSSFGRYFAQGQVFTLLTIWCFWRTLHGSGPIRRGALWLTAGSFIFTFLSWEGTALIAPGMVLAAVLERRGRLHTVLRSGPVWLALLVVAAAVLMQYCHAVLVKTQFLWYGTSLSDLTLRPMWRYPGLQPWYYVLAASWTQDTLLPVLGVLGAVLLAVRHPWRRPVRFLLVIVMTTCLSMALTLPGLAWRYIHHLIPLVILLASATLVAALHSLVKLARRQGLPAGWSICARGLGIGCAVVTLALASGLTVQLAEIRWLRVEGYGLRVFKFPDFEGPARYVSEHMAAGDVVLATDPFHVNHLVRLTGRADFRADFWMATALRFPATIDDRRSVPLDRRDGTRMVGGLEGLEDIFARHARVWIVVQPERHDVLNERDVGVFLRQHMDVVYEDWEALVLFRGDRHRSASQRRKSEVQLNKAQASYLP